MIELTPAQARCGLLGVFDMDDAEHFGYYDELFNLDFTRQEDAAYAINKWIKPEVEISKLKNSLDYKRVKEGLRRLISLNRMPSSRHAMPGFEFSDGMTMEEYPSASKKFMLLLWDILYEEPFVPADLSQYRIRVDAGFVKNPNSPELWGDPVYASEDIHDAEVSQGAPEDLPIKKPRDEGAKTGWLSRFFKNK